MKKNVFKEIIDFIEEEEKKYDFSDLILNYIKEDGLEKVENADWLRELFEKANEDYEITDTEIIYYSNAIKYLQENDPSLRDSMDIVYEYWYTADKINSELLASLLASRNNQEDYQEFIDSVIEKFEGILLEYDTIDA